MMKRFVFAGASVLALSGAALADGFIGIGDFSGNETVINFNATDMTTLGHPTANIGSGITVTDSGGGTGFGGWRGNIDWSSYFSNIPGASLGRALADSWGMSDLKYDLTGAGNPNRVGMLLSTGVQTTWTVEIYGPSNNLIDSGQVQMPGGAQAVFVGYEASGGIGYMRLMDVENGYITIMDDVRFEAVGGYRLSVSGTCPGTVTVQWSGATPSVQQGIVFGQNQGTTIIPGGPCAGTQLGVQGGVQLVNTIGTGGGSGSVNGNAGTAACGHYLQLVEVGSCNTSNVDNIP